MGTKTTIEWTRGEDGSAGATWTPIRARNISTGKIGWHCEHATTGCEFCYAEGINKRLGTGLPFKPGHLNASDIEVFLDEKMLLAPLRWRKPRRIFVCSMTDLFARSVTDEWIDRVFAVMALCPQHVFQVLTKRAERMLDYFGKRRFLDVHPLEDRADAINKAMDDIAPRHWCKRELQDYSEEGLPLPNVWLGVSVERQQEANERIPLLLQTPSAVRFISAEPLLGPIDLTSIKVERAYGTFLSDVTTGAGRDHHGHSFSSSLDGHKLDWVIVGGESGPNARPMHPDWARGIRDQCAATGTPLFFKQWGTFAPPHGVDEKSRDFARMNASQFGRWDAATDTIRVGKNAAGRMLDGREHNDMPNAMAR